MATWSSPTRPTASDWRSWPAASSSSVGRQSVTLAVVTQMAVSGALIGLVYALIAYGFQLTFATSKSINFGQGELVMVSAFFSLTLITWGVPYWLVGAA